MPKRPPADVDATRHGSARDHARTTIRRVLALAELGTPAHDLEPQEILDAVAHLLAAAVEVGGLPSCSVTAEVSRLAGQVLAVARKDGAELARAAAGIG